MVGVNTDCVFVEDAVDDSLMNTLEEILFPNPTPSKFEWFGMRGLKGSNKNLMIK